MKSDAYTEKLNLDVEVEKWFIRKKKMPCWAPLQRRIVSWNTGADYF